MPSKPTKSFSDWPSIDELLGADKDAPTALLGAPLGLGCVTPGRCDLAPDSIRAALPRISTYDVQTGDDLMDMSVFDAGNVTVESLEPKAAFAPIVEALTPLCQRHELTLLLGGNNAVTRPGVHAVGSTLRKTGLLTLDAHFDLRPLERGLINGNPVSALLADGLPGGNIVQIGLAPFANSRAMAETARESGISFYTLEQCAASGLDTLIAAALSQLSARCDYIYADFDIDVIDRALSPGAPGGRSGGFTPREFFKAARQIAAHPKLRAADLTEFDPALDNNQTTALIAARWIAEMLMGFKLRKPNPAQQPLHQKN